ncbi:MAG: FHA domain-containing protein [Cryobacterium sp.]|nr:FHA domain-containing protein [Oligoflexia bacterium]
MSAAPVLLITREGENVRSQSLDTEISVGRGEGNVVRLEDRAVSRRHALIRKTSEGVQIEKQSDFAPIRLNGVECTRALLKEGDVVEIGPFRMSLEAKKETVREVVREVIREVVREAAPAPVSVPNENDATLMIPDFEMQKADPLPSDRPTSPLGESAFSGLSLNSELTVEGAESAPELAQPILGDTSTAESESADPGTNFFDRPSTVEEEVLPELNIGFDGGLDGSSPDLVEEISPIPIDEDAATNILKSFVEARLEISDGLANVDSFDLIKDEITLGRGRECDIVLHDKKSSRKNTSIVRVGNRYRVKDLGSSNGTYLNGRSVTDVELSHDDLLRVGDVEIRFVALNGEYEKKKDQFLPVESVSIPTEAAFTSVSPLSTEAPSLDLKTDSATVKTSFPPSEGQPTPPARKGLGAVYEKYVRNFKTLKPIQKILVVLVVGLFLSWYFEDELGLVEKPKAKVATVKKNTEKRPSVSPDYDALTPEKKAQIDEAVRKATDFLRQQDFDKAIYEVQTRVYPILPDYSQAKEIERYAQEGKRRKDAIEEEAKRKEEEAKLKAHILDLEKQTRGFMTAKKYEQAKESFSEILAIDPDNASVSGWKTEIEAWLEERARVEQERLVQQEIDKRAWDTYNEGFELHKAGKFRQAIDIYRKVAELGSIDSVLLRKAGTMIQTCKDSIRDLREPHLVKAKELEQAADLAAAFKEFQLATEVDPTHPLGWAGMERIRDILTERAKILYTEAVIAESYSDFTTAHDRFSAILKMAPEGSLYYQRAQRKMQSYLNFKSDKTEEAPHE